LISAYKHIVRENTSPKHRSGNGNNRGDLLTTDERKKLLTNFKGYDISPDMVRLSLVNLYLHGFVQPQILEYDTLTSEERWNEYADVIFANPPFMSPKGGIKPHKKFSVPSNRSEVLFVDYIAEHLKPTGRAAVIVPEGIIFQSAGAYKQLRKMLVENHLFAVVSLPAGLFNPYSGVKTSVLFMDRQLAKKCDSILFVKIGNDGYGLGAQRREQDGSDLPDAVNVISDYMKAARSGKLDSFKTEEKPCGALLVEKEKLAENEEYNLTADRYRTTRKRVNQKWPMVPLGEVSQVIAGQSPEGEYYNDRGEGTPFYQGKTEFADKYIGSPVKWTTQETRIAEKDDILMSVRAPVGPVNISTQRICIGRGLAAIRVSEKILMPYLFTLLKINEKNIKGNGGAVFDSINRKDIEAITIPLPPLEVQREIVAVIESYQKLIDGARHVVESWKPKIEIDSDWPMVKLVKVCVNLDSKRRPVEKSERKSGQYPYYGASGIVDYVDDYLFDGDYLLVSEDGANLVARVTPIAFSINGKNWVNNHAHILHFDNMNTQKFVETYLNSINLEKFITGMAQPKLNQAALNGILIPLPPLEIQREIVAKIEAERKVVNGCKDLIALYEAKIKQVIDKVWED
jgi:type I restriction enzyme M protein